MDSPIFGLKEFADREATLCTGDLQPVQDDLSALEAWLMGQDTLTDSASNTQPAFTNRTVPSLDSLEFDFGGNFDCLSVDLHQKIDSPAVVFEEDPLSCLLNTSNSFVSSPDLKVNKRGRKPKKSLEKPPAQPRKLRRSILFTPVSTPPPSTTTTTTTTTSNKLQSSPTVQYRQKRFAEDLYSPLLVRGRGSDREGCCPLCVEPQVWLKIKQSAYWYHMNFYHGICASTGRPYDGPLEVRFEPIIGKTESVRVEGFCKDCEEWVVIAPENPKMAPDFPKNSWYKHAQKCQSRLVTDIEYPESLLR